MRRSRRLLAPLLAGLLAALTLAACGAKTDAITPNAAHDQSLSLELDWLPNADHSGIYAAQSEGDFTKAGLKVAIHSPIDAASPLGLLESGRVDVAISYEPQLMLARQQGATVLAFGALIQRPLTSIISLGSQHIRSLKDLRGKTIGTSGIPYERAELTAILAHAGVPASSVKIVDVGEDLVPAMLSGRVDATIGGYWNYEAIQLRRDHRRVNVTPVDQAGIPNYDELVFTTTETYFADHVDVLRRFVQAVGRGYAQVRADPQIGVNALTSADPSLDAGLQAASIRATLPAYFPGDGHPWGWQNQTQWNAFGKWMVGQGLLRNGEGWVEASTNQLLAGQGP